jgi:diguanylate cyclase (GGDEF)-like protein/PAS domain S-box-containing protein
MPQTGSLVVALVFVTLLLVATWWLLRRQRNSLEELSQRVQRIAVGGSLQGRVDLRTDHPELAALTTAINHVLARASTPAVVPAPAIAAPVAQPAPEPALNAISSTTPVSVLGERVHESVLIHGADGIIYANQQFATLMGAPAAELIGRNLAEILPPEYSELVSDNIRRRLAGEAAQDRYEVDLVGLQGQNARLELSSWPIMHNGQPVLLIVGVEVLPTQTVAALNLKDGGAVRSRARLALESLDEAIVTTDARGRIDYVNPAASNLLGISADAARGMELETIARLVDEADRKLLIDPLRQALESNSPVNLGRRAVLVTRGGGGDRQVEVSAAPLRSETGENAGAVLLLHDVTEARGLTRQMSYQATHDALTGLTNRREFERRLQECLDNARHAEGTSVLCYLDLDRFKLINDTAGHLAGDGLLRDVAKLLREAVRDSDTVARLGGDEFGLLLTGCPLDKARQIATDLCRKVADYRYVWKDKVFELGVSIGLVGIGVDSGTMEQVLTAADSACYAAKRQGGHIVIYSAHDEAQARESGEIHWLKRLQAALRDKRFELYCQPIVAAFSGDDHGPAMEVLMRLRGEDGRPIEPAEFMAAAEQYRLMALIDRQVIQTTLTALGNGDFVLPAKRSVAINVSGQTLADTEFLEFVVECFDSTGANPAQVCFEIAENAVAANMDFTRRFIGVLHGMGCRFALDDFGSGMGSFSNLKNLAVDYLKIDGSFMRNLGRDAVNQEMVTAMMRMARALNFKVIAEQLEDSAAVEAARRIGVDYLQGYAIARPEPMIMPIAA